MATARSIKACGLLGKYSRYQLRVCANKRYLEALQRSPRWAPGPSIAEVACGCNLPVGVACPEALPDSRIVQLFAYHGEALQNFVVYIMIVQCPVQRFDSSNLSL
jgi:hypothetical protein